MAQTRSGAPPAFAPPSTMAPRPAVPSWISPRRFDAKGIMSSSPPPRRRGDSGPSSSPPRSSREGAEQVVLTAMNEELEAMRRALSETIASAARARRDALEAAERDLVELATAIAERVIGRELELDPGLIADWAREGVEALGEQDEIIIAIAPDLAAMVPPEQWSCVLDMTPIVDPSLPESHCEVRAGYSRVDESVRARLDAVVAAMQGPEK